MAIPASQHWHSAASHMQAVVFEDAAKLSRSHPTTDASVHTTSVVGDFCLVCCIFKYNSLLASAVISMYMLWANACWTEFHTPSFDGTLRVSCPPTATTPGAPASLGPTTAAAVLVIPTLGKCCRNSTDKLVTALCTFVGQYATPCCTVEGLDLWNFAIQ